MSDLQGLRTVARPKRGSCAYCRDGVEAEEVVCLDCGLVAHDECVRDLGRGRHHCPNPGCAGWLHGARPFPEAREPMLGVELTTLICLSVVPLLLFLFSLDWTGASVVIALLVMGSLWGARRAWLREAQLQLPHLQLPPRPCRVCHLPTRHVSRRCPYHR